MAEVFPVSFFFLPVAPRLRFCREALTSSWHSATTFWSILKSRSTRLVTHLGRSSEPLHCLPSRRSWTSHSSICKSGKPGSRFGRSSWRALVKPCLVASTCLRPAPIFSTDLPGILLASSTVRAFITTRRRSHTRVSLRSRGSLSPTPPSLLIPAASSSESELRPKSAQDPSSELRSS
ncbi:expressed unknown protein [Ectocarpus siliculosus]|uniref:Uncharacterized protein n=1 Tax=Ectocarpus siliculosus TaxID=2880 RepID=D7FNN7_ECTSI|nr:expressed unknown protein [Ectocarpus siliculosus]|eukprot:CBJ26048.1 expressed unknown protein [Ectocarpus siliculosus]